MRSSRQKAICAATSARPARSVRRLTSPTARDCSLSDSDTGTRVPRNAGSRPQARPVMSDMPAAKAITRQSIPVSSVMSALCPLAKSPSRRSRPHTARPRPTAPPARPRIRLSTSSWRMSRTRPAPRESRTAISRSRDVARATSRLATLPLAIRSSTTIIARRTYNAVEAWSRSEDRPRPAGARTMRSARRRSAVSGSPPRRDAMSA